MTSKNAKKRQLPFQVEEIHLKKGQTVEITGDMIIGDVILAFPETIEPLKEMGIHCVGCYASSFDTIEEGVSKHGIDPEKVVKMLNKVLKKSHKKHVR